MAVHTITCPISPRSSVCFYKSSIFNYSYFMLVLNVDMQKSKEGVGKVGGQYPFCFHQGVGWHKQCPVV